MTSGTATGWRERCQMPSSSIAGGALRRLRSWRPNPQASLMIACGWASSTSGTFTTRCPQAAEVFSRKVPYFMKVYHPDFVGNPGQTIITLAMWSGLTPFKFNVSQVGNDKDVKKLLSTVG